MNLGLDIVNLGLHTVDGVGLPCVKKDLFAVEGGPSPGPRHYYLSLRFVRLH
jgi:hypothetical protein